MNVAAVNHCKKLYELSAWGEQIKKDRLDIWGIADDGNASVITQESLAGWPTKLVPAYNLGFLLRKLPPNLSAVYQEELYLMLELDPFDKSWVVQYTNEQYEVPQPPLGVTVSAMAKTPEDAACLLAIKLFEEGVLTK